MSRYSIFVPNNKKKSSSSSTETVSSSYYSDTPASYKNKRKYTSSSQTYDDSNNKSSSSSHKMSIKNKSSHKSSQYSSGNYNISKPIIRPPQNIQYPEIVSNNAPQYTDLLNTINDSHLNNMQYQNINPQIQRGQYNNVNNVQYDNNNYDNNYDEVTELITSSDTVIDFNDMDIEDNKNKSSEKIEDITDNDLEDNKICKNIINTGNVNLKCSVISYTSFDNILIILLDVLIINNTNKKLTSMSLSTLHTFDNIEIEPIIFSNNIKKSNSNDTELLSIHKSYADPYSISRMVIKMTINGEIEMELFGKKYKTDIDIIIPNFSLVLNGILTTNFECGCCSNNQNITPKYFNIEMPEYIKPQIEKKISFIEPDDAYVTNNKKFVQSETFSDIDNIIVK